MVKKATIGLCLKVYDLKFNTGDRGMEGEIGKGKGENIPFDETPHSSDLHCSKRFLDTILVLSDCFFTLLNGYDKLKVPNVNPPAVSSDRMNYF